MTEATVLESLKGRVTLVSGASSGIGAAIAHELSLHIIINYPCIEQESAARKVLDDLRSGSWSIMVDADLTTMDGPKRLAAAALQEFGKVDILVNNAGYSVTCDILEASDDQIQRMWDQMVNLNSRGSLLLTRAIIPLLSPIGSRVINIGSSTSRDPDSNCRK